MDGKDHLKDGTLASPHLGFLPLGRLACAAGLLFLAGSGVAGTQMAQVELSIFKLVSASAEIGTRSKTPKEHQISLIPTLILSSHPISLKFKLYSEKSAPGG